MTFENCHWPRRFLTFRWDEVRVCQYSDILDVHDLGKGDLRSVLVSTSYGRCRIFAHWQSYELLSTTLEELSQDAPRGSWSDDPRLIPLYVLIMLAIVGGLVWLVL